MEPAISTFFPVPLSPELDDDTAFTTLPKDVSETTLEMGDIAL
jgi:hypothetical protein